MKKILSVAVLLVMALAMASGISYAASVEGSVAAVDAAMMGLELDTAEGAATVYYNESTVWPEGITDPADLVGQQVVIDQDDVTFEAASVAVQEKAPEAVEVQPVVS